MNKKHFQNSRLSMNLERTIVTGMEIEPINSNLLKKSMDKKPNLKQKSAFGSSAPNIYDRPVIFPRYSARSVDSFTPSTKRINPSDLAITIKAIRTESELKMKYKRAGSFKIKELDPGTYDYLDSSYNVTESLSQDSETEIISDSGLFNDKNNYLCELYYNRNTLKKTKILQYRENVFRAASRLTTEIPTFPDWAHQNKEVNVLNIKKINVGGQIFQIFDENLSNLIHTKLSQCLKSHKSPGIPYFDRDYICFSAIINFYRTGRLHLPPNTCLTLFEEELEFWGISEQFMEPCCWTEYASFKKASNVLKKYREDLDNDEDFHNFNQTHLLDLRKKVYKIMTSGTGGILARYVSSLCAFFIVLGIFVMVLGTSKFGRVSIYSPYKFSHHNDNETLSNYFSRTKVEFRLVLLEVIISGYFLAELTCRFLLCPTKLELFSDTLNWVDLLATVTTMLAYVFSMAESTGSLEGYLILLRLPRIFRLLKLTANFRSGLDAFILTLRASANELKLIFLLLIIMTSVFGSLIFVVEMVNEDQLNGIKSSFKNTYFGMWWAIVTMTSVGFGDFVPVTSVGYLLGSLTIMIGVIICQLPVPIVLKNFLIYNNQARARLNHKLKIYVRCLDPESKRRSEIRKTLSSDKRFLRKKIETFFNNLK